MKGRLQLSFILFGLIYCSSAALNGRCTGKVKGEDLTDGICIRTSTCKEYMKKSGYNVRYVDGGCPYDSSDIKCCLVESCNGYLGDCQWTSEGCDAGDWYSGTFTITRKARLLLKK
jgi:hypothetical protein